jgi:hypothetical protein
LGKEVICGQCQQRFIAAAEAPFGSQYARPEPPQASREAGFESVAPSAPTPAQEPGTATGPQQPGEPPPQQPQPAQWQQPGQPERAAPPPRPAGAPQPPPRPGDYGPPPMPGQPYEPYGPYGMLPRASGTTAALVLGIISIVGCWCCWGIVGLICGSLAIVFGGNAMRDIDAGRADPIDRGKAGTGRICGIIGLIISILILIASIIGFATNGSHWKFNNYRF